MGIINSILGREEQSEDDGDFVHEDDFEEEDDWEDDFEEEDDWEEDDEEEELEWESAYMFASDMLEEQGFTSMNDFLAKAMFRRVRQSPKFRDRIESGVNTINKLSQTKQQMEELKGAKKTTDWNEVAEKMESADRAIKAADSMSGKEDMMVQQALSVGSRLADSFAKGRMQQSAGEDVNAGMSMNREEL